MTANAAAMLDLLAEREASSHARLCAAYPRTPALAALDPEGKRLCVDLASVAPGHGRTLRFTAFGCHGTRTASLSRLEGIRQLGGVLARRLVGRQRAVSASHTRFHEAARQPGVANLAFLLGDNFYESGVPALDHASVDALFAEGFHDVYDPSAAYFALLGNHDYNLHDGAVKARRQSPRPAGALRALAQVDYGYRRAGRGFHMPHRYYCVVSELAELFVLDTTLFLFDAAQQAWLCSLYAQLAGSGKWKLLLGHHGIVSFGARASSPRARDARGTQDLGALATSGALHERLFSWLVARELHFDLNVAAHDHFCAGAELRYASARGREQRTYYVLAGGGGASLARPSRAALERLAPRLARVDLMQRKHGFASFELSEHELRVAFHLLERGRVRERPVATLERTRSARP